MKYAAAILLFVLLGMIVSDRTRGTHFIQKWESEMDQCADLCNTAGHKYSRVLTWDDGGCWCDNEAGRDDYKAYKLYVNGQCDTGEDRN